MNQQRGQMIPRGDNKWCPKCGEGWNSHYDVCRECGYDPSVEDNKESK